MTVMPNTRRYIGLGQSTPPMGPLGTASQVVFSPDNSQVYAAVKGNPDANVTGFIAVWDMSPSGLSDAFTRVELPSGAVAPFSLTAIPGMNGYVSAYAGVGVDVFDFSNGPENASASNRTQSFGIPDQVATCWSAYSAKTGSFYTSDLETSIITEVSLAADTWTPSVVNTYPIQEGVATLDVEVATVGDNECVLFPSLWLIMC